MFVAWELYDLRDLAWFSVLDLHYADPAQPLATAGGELDDLDRDLSDLSDLSVRGVAKVSGGKKNDDYSVGHTNQPWLREGGVGYHTR